MRRGKLIKNPLKFGDERENNNASCSLQSQAPSSEIPSESVEISIEANEAPSEAPTNSISSDGATHCSSSKSSSAWMVEIIDSTNTKRKDKVKVKDICNLPRGDHVIVEFDEHGAAYGNAQVLLAGYCGILATNACIFPISFEKWSGQETGGMPKSFKDDCFDTMIKPHFHFTSTEKIAYRYCLQSIAKKWATYRQKLWNEFYDPTMRREALVNKVPNDVPRDQWACFINYRLKPSTVELCRKNKESRNKQTIPHTCGSKSNSRRRHEMGKINSLESELHNSQQKVTNLESKLQQSFDMMKAYLMMKEGGIPEALVGFFSAPEANDAGSEPTTPFDARRSSGDSNGNHRTIV